MKKIILSIFILAGISGCTLTAETLTVSQSGNYLLLQEAIRLAGSGDEIIILPGTYASEDIIEITNKSDLTITGRGEVNLFMEHQYKMVMYINNSHNITVRNIRMRHTNPPEDSYCTGEVVLIEDSSDINLVLCEIDGCGLYGVRIWYSDDIVIEGCHIHHNRNAALDADTVNGLSLIQNTITRNGDLFYYKQNLSGLVMSGNELQLDLDYNDFHDFRMDWYEAEESAEPEQKRAGDNSTAGAGLNGNGIFPCTMKLDLMLLEKSAEMLVFKLADASNHFYLMYSGAPDGPGGSHAGVKILLEINSIYQITLEVTDAEMASAIGLVCYGHVLDIE